MNFNNCASINGSVEEYLQHLQDQTNLTLIPAVVMLSIFAITGLIGNILVLVVYSKKFRLNPTKVLIMTIASFDLVANVGAIPSEVNIMFDSWNFSNAAFCKFKVFLVAFTTFGGAASLLAVAVVRYRKICRPHSWQMTTKHAKIASFAACLIAVLISIPYFILAGIKTKTTPCSNIKGYECFANDQYYYTIWPLLCNIFYVLLYVGSSSTLVILYIFIGVTAWKHGKQLRLSVKCSKPESQAGSTDTVLAGDKDNKRLQVPRHTSSLIVQKSARDAQRSVTDARESATDVSSKGRLNSLFCWKRCTSEYDRQESGVMNALTSTKNCDTNEHSRKTSLERISQEMTDTEDISIQATNSAEIVHNVTLSEEIYRREIISEESNPEKSTAIAWNAASLLNINVTSNACECIQSVDHKTVSTTETLDMSHTTGQVNRIHNPHESTVGGKYWQNKCATLHSSNCENEQISKTLKNDVTQNYLNKPQITPKRESKSNPLNKERTTTRSKRLGRTTAILTIISAIYVLGYFPYLILTTLKFQQPDKYASFNMVELSIYNLFQRLYFVNSVANPIIYSLCNTKFRRECIGLFTYTQRRRL